MEIKFGNIILRDPRESDIEDEIRWNTVETEWALWDAPWEMEEWLPTFDPVKFRTEELESLKKPVNGFRWGMEVDTADGVHIGSVNTYLVDESYEWIKLKNVKEGQRVFHTVGIEINEPAYWNRGIGTQALTAYIQYHLDNGHQDICLQTWSGNTRMIKSAEKLGFRICEREVGIRNVRGGIYDGLTFCLDVDKFRTFYTAQINEKFMNLCSRFHVPVQINATIDQDAPRFYAGEESGVPVITLNAAKIPAAEYEAHVGYHVGKILLPSLKLETERLILRRYKPQDAAGCFAFLFNERDAYMDCCKAFTSMDEAYYERVALFGQRETQYMITLKGSSEVIGTVNVFADDSRAVDAMEIGYSIASAHQRKGYAFEALSALLDLLQKELCLEMVTAGILPENIASEKLLTKLGFHKEGLRHKAFWHEGLDKPVDLIYYYRDRKEK